MLAGAWRARRLAETGEARAARQLRKAAGGERPKQRVKATRAPLSRGPRPRSGTLDRPPIYPALVTFGKSGLGLVGSPDHQAPDPTPPRRRGRLSLSSGIPGIGGSVSMRLGAPPGASWGASRQASLRGLPRRPLGASSRLPGAQARTIFAGAANGNSRVSCGARRDSQRRRRWRAHRCTPPPFALAAAFAAPRLYACSSCTRLTPCADATLIDLRPTSPRRRRS